MIEGDEYDSAFFDKTAKFLKYLPDIAVVNNIEFDHADIYADLDAIRLAFRRFVNLVPRRGLLLLGADNAEALALREPGAVPGGDIRLADGADWQAHDLHVERDVDAVQRAAATARRSGTFEMPLLGAYNVRNALAAIAVGAAVGSEHRHDGGRAAARSRACAAGWSMRGTARRRHGLRRLRAPSDRGRRDAGRRAVGVSRTAASGRSSSRARRRRAAGCSRTISPARLAQGRSA